MEDANRRYKDTKDAHRVMIWVQFIRGVGHLRRIGHIAKCLVRKDSRVHVTILSGGSRDAGCLMMPPSPRRDGGLASMVDFVQLPPVFSDDTGKLMATKKDGTEGPLKGNHAWKSARRDELLRVFERIRPHVLLIEMFPFGRRQFKFELKPLLNAAHAMGPNRRPVVLCSLRDILVATKHPHKHGDMVEVFNAYFDMLLVHGDPNFVPLSRTLTSYASIPRSMIAYTGYVVPHSPKPAALDDEIQDGGYVLVSVGSGRSGSPAELFDAAIRAGALLPKDLRAARAKRWKLVCGPCAGASFVRDLRVRALEESQKNKRDFVVESAISGGLFESGALNRRTCVLSISMGGYNTVVEGVISGVPMIVIPAIHENDEEQLVRVRELSAVYDRLEVCTMRASKGTTAAKMLASAIVRLERRISLRAPVPYDIPFAARGSEISAEIILSQCRIASERRAIADASVCGLSSSPSLRRKSSGCNDGDARGTIDLDAKQAGDVVSRDYKPGNVLTVVLLNYKRPDNLRTIVRKLMQQTIRPRIFLWNNSERRFRTDGVTWQIDTSENKFCWPRWFMASLAKTTFVCTMDDDLVPKDDRVLEDMCSFLEDTKSKSAVIGPFGMILDPKKPYAEGRHVNVHHLPWHKMKPDDGRIVCNDTSGEINGLAVDLIKGRMMMTRREALNRKLGFVFDHTDVRGDDIAVSGTLADGRVGAHVVPRLLHRRLAELAAPHALCSGGSHYERRESVRRRFFAV
eukprot:g4255.t1